MKRLAALTLAALVLTGCSAPAAEPAVPKITVGGVPDSQTSLTPDEILPARKAAGIADCPTAMTVPAGHPSDGLPDLTLDCLGGDTTVNLAALPTGKPYVINLWAQWCGPCMTEAPYFGEVWKQARGKVEFLGINYQDPAPGKAIDFARHYGLTYPELHDPKTTSKVPLRIGGIPQTLFVDAQGHVVHREANTDTSADMLRGQIKQHLGVDL